MTISTHSLHEALFKAAKVGHISLMLEFIEIGANPYELDSEGFNAIFYAKQANPVESEKLLRRLSQMKITRKIKF